MQSIIPGVPGFHQSISGIVNVSKWRWILLRTLYNDIIPDMRITKMNMIFIPSSSSLCEFWTNFYIKSRILFSSSHPRLTCLCFPKVIVPSSRSSVQTGILPFYFVMIYRGGGSDSDLVKLGTGSANTQIQHKITAFMGGQWKIRKKVDIDIFWNVRFLI